MSFIEIFPPALLAADKWEDVVLFLLELPASPREKKYAIVDWCNFVGAALTHEMVEQVLGPLAERV